MSAPATVTPAVRALEEVVEGLRGHGFPATRDAGAFFPQPVGILVGLPTLVRRTAGARSYTIPLLVVSGDPFNATPAVDRALELVDELARFCRETAYAPSSWRSSVNAEPLPAFELTVTHTVYEEVSP